MFYLNIDRKKKQKFCLYFYGTIWRLFHHWFYHWCLKLKKKKFSWLSATHFYLDILSLQMHEWIKNAMLEVNIFFWRFVVEWTSVVLVVVWCLILPMIVDHFGIFFSHLIWYLFFKILKFLLLLLLIITELLGGPVQMV